MMMTEAQINNKVFRDALLRIFKVTPLLRTPIAPDVIIDVHKEKMRAANNVQLWVTDAPGVPDMQLTATKAGYLAKLIGREPDDLKTFFVAEEHAYKFVIGATAITLVKPLTHLYRNVEEVLLKPVLTNDDLLQVATGAFERAVADVSAGANPRAVKLSLLPGEGVVVSGKEEIGNEVSVRVPGEYKGKIQAVHFPTHPLEALTGMLADTTTNFRFGHGTKYRPAPLLATDTKSGLTVVLSPTHE